MASAGASGQYQATLMPGAGALSSPSVRTTTVAGALHFSRRVVILQTRGLSPALRLRYHPFSYLHEIGQALAAADLAVCRAGASTLGELPYFGLPALLVPYPHAWRYQRVNAQWLTSRGAGMELDDARLAEELVPTVQSLLADPRRLGQMRERARALARPDAAARLAAELWALAEGEETA